MHRTQSNIGFANLNIGHQIAGATISPLKTAQRIYRLAFGILFIFWTLGYTSIQAAAPSPVITVPKTGQITCHPSDGVADAPIPCAASTKGQDGDLKMGMTWPQPRFKDNNDGTVIDLLTGLIWLKDANCDFLRAHASGSSFDEALSAANGLATGTCELSDGSSVGDWRLPNIKEIDSLISSTGYTNPSIPNTVGTAQWVEGNPFKNVQNIYWSSTTNQHLSTRVLVARLDFGSTGEMLKTDHHGDDVLRDLWPVKGPVAGSYPSKVAKTGQIKCFKMDGTDKTCNGTGQDGELQKGLALPEPRFTKNSDGTVTDHLTGLFWLQNLTCLGNKTWAEAINLANALQDTGTPLDTDDCGLSDGSKAGDWRLPNIKEGLSLMNYGFAGRAGGHPAMSNSSGTGGYENNSNDPFKSVHQYNWVSTTGAGNSKAANRINTDGGYDLQDFKSSTSGVWLVKGSSPVTSDDDFLLLVLPAILAGKAKKN